MRIADWISDVCSADLGDLSDLLRRIGEVGGLHGLQDLLQPRMRQPAGQEQDMLSHAGARPGTWAKVCSALRTPGSARAWRERRFPKAPSIRSKVGFQSITATKRFNRRLLCSRVLCSRVRGRRSEEH